MADDERAVDAEPVEDRERIGRKVGGRVAVGGPPALAVPTRIRRNELEASGDRVREEIPVPPVIADSV